jgi:hypothetical protein
MRRTLLSLCPALVLVLLLACAGTAAAEPLEGEGGGTWQLEQPAPPPPSQPGVAPAPAPVGLGRVGDIEFAPGMTNRGALITAGNPPTVPAGVWEFNGVSWHELASVCGGSEGRIVWAGPEEFWTISDGRPGQATSEKVVPPITENTLCRFSNPGHAGEPLRVMESFAAPAFEADSYQRMYAGACLNQNPDDCWFAGEPLPAESVQTGAFHLHWNGSSLLEEPYPGEGHPVRSMQSFEGRIYESVKIREGDRTEIEGEPAPLHAINPEGASPLFEPIFEAPLYGAGELPAALDFLHLSAAESGLWGAAGPQATPAGSEPGQLTIVRLFAGGWRQILGPEQPAAPGSQPIPGGETVSAFAAEPGSEDAWVGLDGIDDYEKATAIDGESSLTEHAQLARVSAAGLFQLEELPARTGNVAGLGAALALTCPSVHDCWMATTQGWIFHLATAQELQEKQAEVTRDRDPAFETLITERPKDKGLPEEVPTALPEDDSGLLGELTHPVVPKEHTAKAEATRVTVPLLSKLHARLVHGTTLELRFHLAVKARIKLIARRKQHVVAATGERTYRAGNRSLQLRLNRAQWPTKLQLHTHALAPLPTVSLTQSSETTVTTSLAFPDDGPQALSGLLP